MDKVLENEEAIPTNSIQESMERTSNDGHDDGPKKKVIELESKVDNGGDATPVETMTMTLGSTTKTGQLVELPPELLPMIWTKLDEKNDFLAFRQVNSTWRDLMDPILRKKEIFEIEFTTPYNLSRTVHKVSDLHRFNNCLENRKRSFGSLDSFPCVRFKFSYLWLEEENVQKFFYLYGPFMQSLRLHYVDVLVQDGQLKSLSRLLTLQAANIQHLDLKIQSETMPTVLFDDDQMKLPHLNRLDQGSLTSNLDRIVLKEILGAASNLKDYNLESGFQNADEMDAFIATGKVETIKNIKMKITQSNIQLWEKFGDGLPVLESLKIFLHSSQPPELLSRAASVINNILESTKKTLSTLDFSDQQEHIPGLDFPVLKKVKRLYINCHFGAIFPRGQSLSTIFPKVYGVILSLSGPTSVFWDNFTENNIMPSVHALFVRNLENGQGLCRLFPNLKELIVFNPRLDAVGRIFVQMKSLKSLEFYTVGCHLPTNKFPALDSILTGFSPDTCLRLADSEEMLEDGEAEKLRKNPSILELTELRTFKITGVLGFDRLIVSPRVSGIWAFQRMPKLKVIIRATCSYNNPHQIQKTRAALHAIEPFVQSVGFYCSNNNC